MKSQFADLAVEVTGVGLAKSFGVFGEQTNQEVDATEVPDRRGLPTMSSPPARPRRDTAGHIVNGICIVRYRQA